MNWMKPEITETFSYSGMGPSGSVTYRTEGLRGGDAGHGGFLEVLFDTNDGDTPLAVTTEAARVGAISLDAVDKVKLTFEGDAEILAAVDCFEFLGRQLRDAFPQDDVIDDCYAPKNDMQYRSQAETRPFSDRTYVIHCPRCGSSYLHHQAVIVWDRGEDQAVERQTIAGQGEPRTHRVNSRGSGNPSSRRDGLAIRFTCEECTTHPEDVIEFVLAQHKGETETGWRFTPRRPAPVDR